VQGVGQIGGNLSFWISVDDSQTPNWIDINDSQNPNWVSIAA
jgi:hypothetical protein